MVRKRWASDYCELAQEIQSDAANYLRTFKLRPAQLYAGWRTGKWSNPIPGAKRNSLRARAKGSKLRAAAQAYALLIVILARPQSDRMLEYAAECQDMKIGGRTDPLTPAVRVLAGYSAVGSKGRGETRRAVSELRAVFTYLLSRKIAPNRVIQKWENWSALLGDAVKRTAGAENRRKTIVRIPKAIPYKARKGDRVALVGTYRGSGQVEVDAVDIPESNW